MGNCVGGFKKRTIKLQHSKKVRKIRICVLGLDQAGKSTAIRALASENISDVSPTNGFTLKEFKYRKAEIIAYDLGGGVQIRSIWKIYYPEVFGVIYVVDGCEQNRINESGELLKNVISDECLSGKPLLVILNKIDQERCIDEIQFSDRFNLHDLANTYRKQIRVEVCQSNMGTGKMMDPALRDGFEWLLERIYDDYDLLEKNVNESLQQLKQRQDEERTRRQHQLAATVSRSQRWKRWLPCYIFSSSTSSDEKSADASAQDTVQAIYQDDSACRSVQPAAENITEPEHRSEATTKRWNSRNVVSPMENSAVDFMNKELDRLKYPEIFEVPTRPPGLPPLKALKSLEEHGDDTPPNVNGFNAMNNGTVGQNPRTRPGSVRSNQLIPMTVMPNRQSKRRAKTLPRNDSV